MYCSVFTTAKHKQTYTNIFTIIASSFKTGVTKCCHSAWAGESTDGSHINEECLHLRQRINESIEYQSGLKFTLQHLNSKKIKTLSF